MKIVLASLNPGKILELREYLSAFNLDIIPQKELGIEEIEETGLSFIENAIIKARHASSKSGLPAIADDSGFAVSALGGAPGIYSARYAGINVPDLEHINKLLLTMEDVPHEKRQAQFHCVLAFLLHPKDPTPLICHGKWSGMILHKPRGQHGFGYDPIFFLPDENKTAAELPIDIKNKISHRGKALHLLATHLAEKINELGVTS